MSAYSILGLPEGASKEDARRAYRRLALLYHPDRNSSPEAQRKFIEITEAYQEIAEGKRPKSSFNIYDFYQPVNTNPRYRTAEERERLRQEWAKEYAKQELEEYLAGVESFKKSRYYPLMIVFFHVIRIFFFIVGAFLCMIPFIALLNGSHAGVLFTGLITIPPGLFIIKSGQDAFLDLRPYYRGHKNTESPKEPKKGFFSRKLPGLDFSHSRPQKVLIMIPALFTFLLFADYFLPQRTTHEEVIKNTSYGARIVTEHFSIRASRDGAVYPGNNVIIEYTPIFHTVLTYTNEEGEQFYPPQSIYSGMGIFLPVILILCWMGWATGNPNEADGLTVVTFGFMLLVFLFFM